MAQQLLLGALGIFALVAGAGDALATPYQLTCGNTAGDHLQASLTGGTAWTSPATKAAVVPGDLVELTGTCQGDVVLANVNGVPITEITIANEGATSSSSDFPSDGINGQIEVKNAQLTLQGITLQSGTNGDVMTNGEFANVYIHDNGSATLTGDTIGPGPLIGVYVSRASSAEILSSTVISLGTSNIPKESDGIRVEGSSSVVLARTGSQGTSVLNGSGNGITVVTGSSMEFFDGTVHDNAGAQIYANGASTLSISGVGIETSSTSAMPPLIEVLGGSSATIDTDSFIQNTGGGTASAGLLAASASSVVLNSTTLSTTGVSRPVIEASGNASIVLAGGNNIGATGSGGTVIQVDHSSSVQQQQAGVLGYTPATDTITGGAFIQVQSSLDLGVGVLPNTTDPSLTWSVPSGSCILIQQNSSLRMSGGIAIAGAAPAACSLNGGAVSTTIVIQQESNAFFNLSQGGTNVISNGGISCVFAGMPNAHVTGRANVTPASAQPVIIGSWSQASSVTPPGCLGP
jgi:hypothetical protein